MILTLCRHSFDFSSTSECKKLFNSKPVYRNVSVLFLVVFVTELLGVGGRWRVWMLMVGGGECGC